MCAARRGAGGRCARISLLRGSPRRAGSLSTCCFWIWDAGGGSSQRSIVSTLVAHHHHSVLLHRCEHNVAAECGPRKGPLLFKIWRVDTWCSGIATALANGRQTGEWCSSVCQLGPGHNHARVEGASKRATERHPGTRQPWSMSGGAHSARIERSRACACAIMSNMQPLSVQSRGLRPTAFGFARPSAASRPSLSVLHSTPRRPLGHHQQPSPSPASHELFVSAFPSLVPLQPPWLNALTVRRSGRHARSFQIPP